MSLVVEQGASNVEYHLFRAWNNGDVDHSWLLFNSGNPGANCEVLQECGPVPVIPPPCPADVNDDLSVNVLDLIDLLLVFGSTCEGAG